MGDDKSGWAVAARLLASVDWPRVLHRGAIFIRELRGDRDVERDSIRVQDQARRTREGVERMARAAVGCVAPQPCSCPICAGEQEERKP